MTTGDKPVSAENLKTLAGGGFFGGVVLYDEPSRRPQLGTSTDTVTLGQPCEGFRMLEATVLTAYDSMSDTYVGSCATVKFPSDITSYGGSSYAKNVGIIYEMQTSHNLISVSALSGTTLTMRAKDSIIARVVGYK